MTLHVDVGSTRVELTSDNRLRLPHLGLDVRPANLSPGALQNIDDLLQHEPITPIELSRPVVATATAETPPIWDYCVRVLANCQVEDRGGGPVTFRYGENPAAQSRNANRGPELLAYLALRPNRSATADEIRDDLWWGRPISSHSVDNLLSSTRKILGGDDYLSTAQGERREYHLSLAVVTDVDLLGQALDQARPSIESDPERVVERLSTHLDRIDGAAFRSGHLGEGLAEWSAAYRVLERVEGPVIDAALLAAEAVAAQGAEHLAEALRLLDQGLRVADTNEALARAAMKLEAARGNRDAALARYEALATLLVRDDLEPEHDTTALRHRIAKSQPG